MKSPNPNREEQKIKKEREKKPDRMEFSEYSKIDFNVKFQLSYVFKLIRVKRSTREKNKGKKIASTDDCSDCFEYRNILLCSKKTKFN